MYAVRNAEPSGQRLRDRVAAEARAWRGRLNITQVEIARALNLSQPQVSARMRGHVAFSLEEVEVLADLFGIEPAELLGMGQTRNGPPPGTRATGGGTNFVAPATGLEPVTCRLTLAQPADQEFYPSEDLPAAA